MSSYMKYLLGIFGIASTALMSGCATPGDQVKVSTMSVEDAWNNGNRAVNLKASSKIVQEAKVTAAPYPIITGPDIKFAYVKPWTDTDGTRHYGSWIALQINSPQWVLPDGTLEPMNESLSPSSATKKRR